MRYLGDEAGLLGNRDEDIGVDRFARLVSPSQQCFCTHQVPVGQSHDRLVHQGQVAVVQGTPQAPPERAQPADAKTGAQPAAHAGKQAQCSKALQNRRIDGGGRVLERGDDAAGIALRATNLVASATEHQRVVVLERQRTDVDPQVVVQHGLLAFADLDHDGVGQARVDQAGIAQRVEDHGRGTPRKHHGPQVWKAEEGRVEDHAQAVRRDHVRRCQGNRSSHASQGGAAHNQRSVESRDALDEARADDDLPHARKICIRTHGDRRRIGFGQCRNGFVADLIGTRDVGGREGADLFLVLPVHRKLAQGGAQQQTQDRAADYPNARMR